MKKSCHIWKSHAPTGDVTWLMHWQCDMAHASTDMTHTPPSGDMIRLMNQLGMCTDQGCGKSRHAYEWVKSRIRMSHVTHMNESCHTRRSHVTHTNESCHTWRSHATHTNKSCHKYEWDMSHTWRSHVTRKRDTSHAWMSHVIHSKEPCHTHEWVMSHTRRNHTTHMNESCHMHERVMSHIWMCHVTHTTNTISTSCSLSKKSVLMHESYHISPPSPQIKKRPVRVSLQGWWVIRGD